MANPAKTETKRFKYKCSECGEQVEFAEACSTDVICGKCSAPDWSSKCDVCGASPVVPQTGMCGQCSFGESDTANGDW